ncbi:MAG: ATP-dependent helicase [Proteobacteria bacterium]|nr:ATP-dependent helicase [Pseudomonadota bacterium]MBU2227336.1 ATP-dependent helicase [Pseudomonadota bacterium]MBU2264513.1 ATP-dependent helicase [Patescibacteria group bacterium]
MAWDDNLLPEQRTAAAHAGRHARLLAGPGTGKTLTLTRHICFLVTEQNVSPGNILAVTFTRVAAWELRQLVENELGEGQCPRISTLHSFALRQLIRNETRITDLQHPLRIADDWEERNIILEDLKGLLNLKRISEARDLLDKLSADWQSLTATQADWERRFPNPRFLGLWREHRRIYGYTLRSELVYQLKKALEQRGDFELEGPIEYLLVDEYQDLNRCDLAVVSEIALRDVELFIAGDDDQSIYGFRKAHPEGIRRFPLDYSGAEELSLEICKRCDCGILDLGLFVAQQDHRRIEKEIRSEPGRGQGEVALLRFQDQNAEASGIASLCTHLVEDHGLQPDNILILLRSDHNGVFSGPIRQRLEAASIPVSAATDTASPLDCVVGRTLLAFMRLAVSREDSLAWRTLFQVWCNGVGSSAIGAVYDLARSRGMSFAETVLAVSDNAVILPSNHQSRLSGAISRVLDRLEELFSGDVQEEHETHDELLDVVRTAAESLIVNKESRDSVLREFERVAETTEAASLKELVRATEVASDDIEQEIEQGRVNILSMHRAKGLTAEAVIIAAAEDQYIPGRAQGDAIDDERRLLYVSLTRAKHHLFVTYCDRRTGPQRHTGRNSGMANRALSQFLVDCPHTPQDGRAFINRLTEEDE